MASEKSQGISFGNYKAGLPWLLAIFPAILTKQGGQKKSFKRPRTKSSNPAAELEHEERIIATERPASDISNR